MHFVSFTGPWTSLLYRFPVPVVPQSLNLRRSPVLLSYTGPRTCLAHESGSQFLCRSPVTEPTSFACPASVHGSTDLPRSPVRISFRSRVHGPATLTCAHFLPFTGPRICVVHRSSRLESFIGSPFLCHSPDLIAFRTRVHGPVSFTVSHFLCPSSVPTSPLVHQFPGRAQCPYMGERGGGVLYVPTSLTSYSIPPSLT
jgi:hypothetical protein